MNGDGAANHSRPFHSRKQPTYTELHATAVWPSEEYSEEKLWLFQEAPSKYGILSFLEANRSKDSCNSVWLKSSVTTTLGIKFKFSNLTNNNQ